MRLPATLLLALVTVSTLTAHAESAISHLHYRVIKAYPHAPDAFTEGLFFAHGALYESTGMNGQSSIRKVELATGRVLQHVDLEPAYFGEGIVSWQGRLIQLTWRTHTGFIYDLASLRRTGQFSYPGEGWGLTHNGQQLLMSDGSARLRWLDPRTLQQVGQLDVTEQGQPVTRLNELEWVKGKIFANVWLSSRIVEIDPLTGDVIADLDLAALRPPQLPNPTDDVLNGIAYDPATDHVFVTGKCWPWLYEIQLSPPVSRIPEHKA